MRVLRWLAVASLHEFRPNAGQERDLNIPTSIGKHLTFKFRVDPPSLHR
jgi:hypothetical protein